MTRSKVKPPATTAADAAAALSARNGTKPRKITGGGRTPHLTPAERVRLGKDARRAAPLAAHADLGSGNERDPVSTLIGEDADRVPELMGSSDRFEGAVADFAETYADRNEEDFRLMQRAVRDGRLQVRTGL